MRAILIVNKNDVPIILTPCCKSIIDGNDNIDIEDYIDDNIVFLCPNHNETLICVSGRNNDIDKLENGIINNNCTIKLSYNEFINYIERNNYKNDINYDYFSNQPDNYYYLVGIMNIKKIVQAKDIPDEFDQCEDNIDLIKQLCDDKGFDVNVNHFSQVPVEIDLDHYGPCIYYHAICTECNRESYSYISGD